MSNITERKKKIQYLLADCVSLITKNLSKYKCYTITISNNRNCTAKIIPAFDIYFNCQGAVKLITNLTPRFFSHKFSIDNQCVRKEF
jgi:hypothetical protein